MNTNGRENPSKPKYAKDLFSENLLDLKTSAARYWVEPLQQFSAERDAETINWFAGRGVLT